MFDQDGGCVGERLGVGQRVVSILDVWPVEGGERVGDRGRVGAQLLDQFGEGDDLACWRTVWSWVAVHHLA